MKELKFKVGDKVRIFEQLNGHGFDLEDEVTIVSIEAGGGRYKAKNDLGAYWWISEDEAVLVSEE